MEKKYPPRAYLWAEGAEFITLIKNPETESRKRWAWMSVAEHDEILAEKDKRIAELEAVALECKKHLTKFNSTSGYREGESRLLMKIQALEGKGGTDER